MIRKAWFVVAAACGICLSAHADEGGVSFWAPGQFGSLSAVPGAPGFGVPFVYLHSSKNHPKGWNVWLSLPLG